MGEERTMTLGLAIREALHQEMERDASVIIMGEDIVGGAGSDEPGAEDSWGGPNGYHPRIDRQVWAQSGA